MVNTSLYDGGVRAALIEAAVHPLLKKPTLNSMVCSNYCLVTNIPFLGRSGSRAVAVAGVPAGQKLSESISNWVWE